MHRRDRVVVPPGHEVTVTAYSPFPCFTRARGGALLIDFGIQGSDQLLDVEMLFGRLWHALKEPLEPAHIPLGVGHASDMFAPNRPALLPEAGLVIWTAHQGAFHGFLENVLPLQELLRMFYKIVQCPGMRTHVLYLADDQYVGLGLLPLLRGLGIEVRKPDPGGGVLMEVARPEGVVLSAPMGAALTAEPGVHDAILVLNRRKDAAQEDSAAMREIAWQERKCLAETCRLEARQRVDSPDTPVMRESRLRWHLLAIYDSPGNVQVREELFKALLAHRRPLLVPCDGRGAPIRMQWDLRSGTLIYCDVTSLRQFQAEHGLLQRGIPCLTLTLAELAQLLLRQGHTGALSTYQRPRVPRYTLLNLPSLRALAEERPPTQPEWDAPMSAP